jgi:hypothetical protein
VAGSGSNYELERGLDFGYLLRIWNWAVVLRDTSAVGSQAMELYCKMFSVFTALKAGSVCDPIWPSPSIQAQETLQVSSLQIAAIKGNMG